MQRFCFGDDGSCQSYHAQDEAQAEQYVVDERFFLQCEWISKHENTAMDLSNKAFASMSGSFVKPLDVDSAIRLTRMTLMTSSFILVTNCKFFFAMNNLRAHEWRVVQGFCNLTTLFHLCHTSKYVSRCVDLMAWKRLIPTKLNNLLTDCGLDTPTFWDLLRQAHGTVTGSIFLELMLGCDEFQANDIDIFVRHNHWPDRRRESKYFRYSPLHQYLFQVSTGLRSDPSIKYHYNITAHLVHEVEHPESDVNDHIFPVTEFRAKILTVDNYTMPNGRRLQIVAWDFEGTSWPLFTHKQFDFGICASTFDGVECRLAHLLDVAQKRLRLQPHWTCTLRYDCL